VDGSRHVSIVDADVDTADDAICLKTTSPGHPLQHVVVRDCRYVAVG
jgi:polygalacturonase